MGRGTYVGTKRKMFLYLAVFTEKNKLEGKNKIILFKVSSLKKSLEIYQIHLIFGYFQTGMNNRKEVESKSAD